MSNYCSAAPGLPLHDAYHAGEYGFPQSDEAVLFERLCLEIMQAGLSWTLVLRRRESMRRAFAGWNVDRVAAMGPGEEARLLADPGIVRNRRKVKAVVANAKRVQAMRASHGGFAAWLAAHHPRGEPEWLRLFRATFTFSGPEIVREFLTSLSYLPGAHTQDCPVYPRVLAAGPHWARG